MRIHVSNLATEITDESLNATFATYGKVNATSIVLDGFTGRPRGFGFVEMPDDAEALLAIGKLNGAVVGGQHIAVKRAMPQQSFMGGSYPARRKELK